MRSKLGLDKDVIARARHFARNIAADTQSYIDLHTTVAVERTVLRLLGVNGVDANDVPMPNVVVEHMTNRGLLAHGAAIAVGSAVYDTGKAPQKIAEEISAGTIDLAKIPLLDAEKARVALAPHVVKSVRKINGNVRKRKKFLKEYGDKTGPYLYIIVATGNIYEDIVQAKAAAKQGADIIAVIRTTGQSLLDYVPYGATTEGFGGTYATQENFRLMRAALDEVGAEQKRYIRLCNYCSGLCMPEIAAMGALERLDVMLNDALYGILFRDINMKRTIVDQFFSRVINGYAGVIINTGEDNYLTTADAVKEAHTVLASQFLNEQFAAFAGIPEEQMGLGHAFEIDPSVKNGFLMERAEALMARETLRKAQIYASDKVHDGKHLPRAHTGRPVQHRYDNDKPKAAFARYDDGSVAHAFYVRPRACNRKRSVRFQHHGGFGKRNRVQKRRIYAATRATRACQNRFAVGRNRAQHAVCLPLARSVCGHKTSARRRQGA